MDRFDMMLPRAGPTAPARQPGAPARKGPGNGEFARALEEVRSRDDAVRFSAHAVQRIEERGLPVGKEVVGALSRAVDLLAEKGGKQSLVLTDHAALVVSVESRTVVTAVERTPGRVFTNIDSAVVI